MKVRDFIALVEKSAPSPGVPGETCDRLVCGSADQSVRAIAVTFLATHTVLRRAVALGANLIVTHEPTFYDHRDDTNWLAEDQVFQAKRRFIEDHALAVWRFHDGCHAMRPDPIAVGIAEALGWSIPAAPAPANVFELPACSARELARQCKARLNISSAVRVAGDLDAPITRVGLLVGAWGGRAQIELFRSAGIDVLVCGESPEWETCEYVRDAVALGRPKALLVIGHANSEEAGIAHLARWMRELVPVGLPVHHLLTGDPFRTI